MAKPSKEQSSWSVEDVVDFEVYLHQDEEMRRSEGGEDLLGKRDRTIYLRELSGQKEPPIDSSQLRKHLFRDWLEARRRKEKNVALRAGNVISSALAHITGLAILGGIIAGILVARNVFYYGLGAEHILGDQSPEPVNVFKFLVVGVLPQFLFACGAAFFIFRGVGGFAWSWPSLYATLGALFKPLIRSASVRSMEMVSVEDRERIRMIVGVVAGRAALHHQVLRWLLPLRIQWFGFFYGASLLFSMTYLSAFDDRSCGWYSSKWLTPSRVETIVRFMAIPWYRVAPEEVGFPSLEQIKGSHIRLNEGTRQLKDSDLKSWLTFLLLCVAVWGVAPRVLVLTASYWGYQRALAKLDFQDLRCDHLYERLTTPRASWEVGGDEGAELGLDDPDRKTGEEPIRAEEVIPEGGCALFAPPDLLDSIDRDLIADLLRAKFGWTPALFENGGGTAAQDRGTVARLSAIRWKDGRPRILFLQRAYMPPTLAILNFVKECRRARGARAKIIVALVGKPDKGNVLTQTKVADRDIWINRLSSLGDPNASVETLV